MDTNLIETYEKYSKLGMANRLACSLGIQLVKALRASIADLHVRGTVPAGQSIFTFYHTSALDAPLMAQYIGGKGNYAHGVMDSNLFARSPFLSSIFGGIPFDPFIGGKKSFKWSMGEIEYWLDQGHSILISNDGATERHNGEKLEEKLISDLHARIAKRTGVKVVPVSPYVHMPEEVYTWKGRTTLLELAKRWRLDYFLGFSDSIDPSDFKNPRELAGETKKRQIAMHEYLKNEERKHREETYSWLGNAISHVRK